MTSPIYIPQCGGNRGNPPQHDNPNHDTRPLAWEVMTSAHPVPDAVMSAIDNSLEQITGRDIAQAHTESWISGFQLAEYDQSFITISEEAFDMFLPYIPSRLIRYVVPDWECRDYADYAKTYSVASGWNAVAKTLDYGEHHSYCAATVRGRNGKLIEKPWEPQAGIVIPRAYPAHHYGGKVGEVQYA